MRLLGWLLSAAGLVGVVVGNGFASVVWLLKLQLETRLRDLMAVPDRGLQVAIPLVDVVRAGFTEMASQVDAVRSAAEGLATGRAQGPDAAADVDAAADLARAVEDFARGPYATMRDVYSRVRGHALELGDTISQFGRSMPHAGVAAVIVERLTAIDARLQEVDASVSQLSQFDVAGLAEPGVAATVVERATRASETLGGIDTLIGELSAWLLDTRDRLVERDRRVARALTFGTIALSLLGLLFAGLNVLLFQVGRRWRCR